MPTLQELARAGARDLLAESASFHQLDRAEQLRVYQDLVNSNYSRLVAARGRPAGGRPGDGRRGYAGAQQRYAGAMVDRASDMIDDGRHYNKRIEQAGDLAASFIEDVDFPGFVRDLLKGVFDANIEVMLKQTDNFIKLMKAATASLAKFVNAIDDTAAFGYLAENNSDEFGLMLDDEEKDEEGNAKPVLADKEGNKMDLGDNEVKAKIMDAKIAMAKEQRALLRETLLMGVTRLVVERGEVNAAVVFDVKATEDIGKADKAANKNVVSSGSSVSASGGLIGSIFGGPRGGHTRSTQNTRISISSAKSRSSTDLQAKVTGNVKIVFKSDYFKLDNFAAMYGPAAPGAAAPGAPAGAPAAAAPALPAAPAAR